MIILGAFSPIFTPRLSGFLPRRIDGFFLFKWPFLTGNLRRIFPHSSEKYARNLALRARLWGNYVPPQTPPPYSFLRPVATLPPRYSHSSLRSEWARNHTSNRSLRSQFSVECPRGGPGGEASPPVFSGRKMQVVGRKAFFFEKNRVYKGLPTKLHFWEFK